MVKRLWFRCPCCGQRAPYERLDGAPYEMAVFVQEFGGRAHIVWRQVQEPVLLQGFYVKIKGVIERLSESYAMTLTALQSRFLTLISPLTSKRHAQLTRGRSSSLSSTLGRATDSSSSTSGVQRQLTLERKQRS